MNKKLCCHNCCMTMGLYDISHKDNIIMPRENVRIFSHVGKVNTVVSRYYDV